MNSNAKLQALVRQAHDQAMAGRLPAAIQTLEKACAMQPREIMLRVQLARLLAVAHRYAEADRALDAALALDSGQALALDLKLHVLEQLGRPREVVELSERILEADPSRLKAAVAGALVLPQIYPDSEAVARWRGRFSTGLERLSGWPHPVEVESLLDLQWPAFLLAYQGHNDRPLQEAHSRVLRRLLSLAGLEDAPDRPVSSGRRIRLAFVSSFFRDCTVGHYFGPWVTDLPRDRFEVTLLHTGPQPDDHTRLLAETCEAFHHLPGGAGEARQTLMDLAPDLIVYPEVGMGGDTYLLSRMRLAPIQVAAWGHPVTTGSEVIDAFVTCEDMEPEDAEDHYSEPLIRLPGLGTRYRPPQVPTGATRAQFSLPEAAHLYLVPQSLHKVHPDNDAMYMEVLRRDSSACLVFIAPPVRELVGLFQQRLQRAMDDAGIPPRQQVKFLPFLPWLKFRQLMTVCDVMLDTLHWSGGQTSIDAIAAGLPIVTTRGPFMRGRQTAAMLEILGASESIAESPEDLSARAMELAGDSELRSRLRARYRDRADRLFDRAEPIEALADALQALVDSRRL